MSLKPFALKLRAAYSVTFMNTSSGNEIVPGYNMWPLGGSMFPFGHISEHRRNERVAKSARNLLSRVLDDEVVLAEHHVRTILFRASGRKNDRGLARLDRITYFRPRELLHEHGIGHDSNQPQTK